MRTVLAMTADGHQLPLSIGVAAVIGIYGLILASVWRVFEKAGQPGWGVLVPFYNLYLGVRIAGRPGWWTAAFFIPVVGWFLMAKTADDFARAFGKGQWFALGLAMLPYIFWPILAFGPAHYRREPRGFDVIMGGVGKSQEVAESS